MTARRDDFQLIEIDALDDKLTATALRKRIPHLRLGLPVSQTPAAQALAIPERTDGLSVPEPAHRPEVVMKEAARRRPLSLEVPDYLARELKVKAATEAVTVRFLVLSALADAGYRVDADELAEDGRRLR
ncbi:MAG: hypothetical protein KJ622_01455 [Alphaproteobacteria bacterium]|nr:hypothetical protein [Alphaproteobacteria bacterium]